MNPSTEFLNEQKKTNKLLALLVLRELNSRTEQILVLSEAGFRPSEIASLVGTTANSVSVAIAKSKKRSKK